MDYRKWIEECANSRRWLVGCVHNEAAIRSYILHNLRIFICVNLRALGTYDLLLPHFVAVIFHSFHILLIS
uniref:Uncharacterized protein n=1 Tax=Kalanchoe fedtschenkoi TaxID=63787 RepID=A0A7N0ZWZ4_KALFE